MEEEKKKSLEDIEFVDAVFGIPKNAYRITINVSSLEDGKECNATAELGPADIREAIDLFEQTVNGDYPMYTLTDEGREYAEKLMEGWRDETLR